MTRHERRHVIARRWPTIRRRMLRWLDHWNEIQRKKMSGELSLVGRYYDSDSPEDGTADALYGSGRDDFSPSRLSRPRKGIRAHRGIR